MAAETQAPETTQAPKDEPKITCFVSKQAVPQSSTVELEYAPGKKVWVQSRYIRYELDAKSKK